MHHNIIIPASHLQANGEGDGLPSCMPTGGCHGWVVLPPQPKASVVPKPVLMMCWITASLRPSQAGCHLGPPRLHPSLEGGAQWLALGRPKVAWNECHIETADNGRSSGVGPQPQGGGAHTHRTSASISSLLTMVAPHTPTLLWWVGGVAGMQPPLAGHHLPRRGALAQKGGPLPTTPTHPRLWRGVVLRHTWGMEDHSTAHRRPC